MKTKQKNLNELSLEERIELENKVLSNVQIKEQQSITKRVIKNNIPTSYCQRRLWFMDQLEPNNPAYNSPEAIRLFGEINIEALRYSLNRVVARHESLRTNFKVINNEPVQHISNNLSIKIPLINLESYIPKERENQLLHLLNKESRRVFNLENDPLIRAVLFKINPKQHVLLLTLHHIITDGWSMRNLFKELSIIYNGYVNGNNIDLQELIVQYSDYTLWQREQIEKGHYNGQMDYWIHKLKDLPILNLPLDSQRPPVKSYIGKTQSITLDLKEARSLKKLAAKNNSTLFMVLLTTFNILLQKYSGQNDIVIGTSVAGRIKKEVENLIGFFVNTLVLRNKIDIGCSFNDLLTKTRKNCLEAFSNQDIPFDLLVNKLHLERDPSKMPLFQVLFQVQEKPTTAIDFTGLKIFRQKVETDTAKYDLMVNITQHMDCYRINFEYNSQLFKTSTIKQLLMHFKELINNILSHPNEKICNLSLLTDHEINNYKSLYNNTKKSFPDLSLIKLFETKVDERPHHHAVIQDQEIITYEEINKRANKLAKYLKRKGIQTECYVGVCVNRSINLIVSILGVLKAGAAYIPLDASYPKNRLNYMINDSGIKIIITDQNFYETSSYTDLEVINLSKEEIKIIEEQNAENLGIEIKPEHPCYVIYTSGSTGKPKGIEIVNRGVVNNLNDLNTRYHVDYRDKSIVLSSPSFDMFVYEVLGILIAGGTCILPSLKKEKDPEHWIKLIQQHKVTIWNSSPALLDLLLNQVENNNTNQLPFRLVLLGGDWVPLSMPDRIKKKTEKVDIVVMGGATEASIHSILYEVKGLNNNWNSIPYGKPMLNQTAYILDQNYQLVPKGVSGELFIGGIGLARGYLNRPDLTAEKFVPNPFNDGMSTRLYKTGDLAKYTDEHIELLGRIDFQVKLHGIRIETAEVESIIKKYRSVKDVVVKMSSTTKNLFAYITLKSNIIPELDIKNDIVNLLQNQLPKYMIPLQIEFIDSLPLSPNGKIDRKALIDPDINTRNKVIVKPSHVVEKKLVNIWKEVLGIDDIGINENFFELGGDSFKAIKAIRTFNSTFPVIEIFKHPTIKDLTSSFNQFHNINNSILANLNNNSNAKFSLICIPYGGGNIVSYYPLSEQMNQDYNLYSVKLPGHNFDSKKERFESISSLGKRIIKEIEEINKPFILYGQCAGAALTLELAKLSEERKLKLKSIFIGASLPNDDLKKSIKIDQKMTDEQYISFLSELGGFQDIFEEGDMHHIINAVRHDLYESANYFLNNPRYTKKLNTSIHCVIGTTDPVTNGYRERYKNWSRYGNKVYLHEIKNAGHYFIKNKASEVAKLIDIYSKN